MTDTKEWVGAGAPRGSGEAVPNRMSVEAARPRRREKLAVAVVEALRDRIANGVLPVGAKLPTEQRLIDEFNVSRTVVREAIAELRAKGLVEPRQGVGVFVTPVAEPAPGLLSGDFTRLSEVLELLEFRMGVEIEAAGLAALRRSSGQEAEILLAHERMIAVVDGGGSAVDADFALHLAIAAATNNHFYTDVLKYLGQRTIPRSRLGDSAEATTGYLRKVIVEHARIIEAIERQDPDGARLAMRHHLTESQRRYRTLGGLPAESAP
ncbi:FadR/GntR family transcriptional regulator [Inquilinus limosus]|uniref:FadR/GntR family transcriptional regulator n=1 Tax=Inquilinus limosus TaxID=171674 RepID=UPI003F5CD882